MNIEQMLNEVCELATMKATAALSKFLKTPVGVEIKAVEIKPASVLQKVLDQKEKMVCLIQPITGDILGVSLLLHSEEAAHSICDALFNRKSGGTTEFNAPEKSALGEVANIVVGNFLGSFAQALQIDSLMHCAPEFEFSSGNNIQKKIIPRYEKLSQVLVMLSFTFEHVKIKGLVLIMLEEEKLKMILNRMSLTTND